ncbi:MAG: hypothetical protein J0H53_04510 [Rhizobiales bacterium]|nr:hypothetical protein [Hyphomicrobiales bacterium]
MHASILTPIVCGHLAKKLSAIFPIVNILFLKNGNWLDSLHVSKREADGVESRLSAPEEEAREDVSRQDISGGKSYAVRIATPRAGIPQKRCAGTRCKAAMLQDVLRGGRRWL